MKLRISILIFLLAMFFVGIASAQDPLNQLKEETLAYFKPLKGKVVSVSGDAISSDLANASGVKKGMRFTILREGAPFLHPITKEPIGNMEAVVGTAVVKDVDAGGSTLTVTKGAPKEGDILRISETKVRVLFFQDKSVDWNLGEQYYRLLKESGRVDLIDTPLDRGDDSVVLAEAKEKDSQVAMVLKADEVGNETVLKQRLLWVDDSSKMADTEVKVDNAFVRDLHFGEHMLSPVGTSSDTMLFFDLPFRASLVASGDVRGDGSQELIIISGRYIRIYAPGTTLQNLYEIKGNASDDYLWMDTLDIDGDGKDEIILTSMRNGAIVSSVYGLRDGEFVLLRQSDLFLRRLNNGLIGQGYDSRVGFSGPIFNLTFENGQFRKGDALKLPKGVNIYDFAPVDGFDGVQYILAYDEAAHLSLYNKSGLKVWSSAEDFGGFQNVFKKAAPTIMVDAGVWSVKDRLLLKNKEVFMVKRVPLATMARGLGNKISQIKTLFWTGLSMEERVLIDDISGSLLDYTIAGDQVIVLSKPLFGIKAKNILKGESPIGDMLYIYSLKGL
ncbi:MAG: VCBS repeat-containing protein [Thermodesulfovibrionales bacterium]